MADISRAESAKEAALVKDLAYSLQSEINRVGTVEDGFERDFMLPFNLEGIPYSTNITQNTLIVNTSEYEYLVTVLPVIGNFTTGMNTIKKQSELILLNS